MTSSEQWRYVATEDNPAYFVSRGMDSLKLKTCELWWNGPKFLMSNQYLATNSCCSDQGSRRGKCAKLYSDNATNFVGANIELKKMFNLVCKPDEALASYMASEGIDWKFLPPRAPNFGGLWEAGVKSFKFYLKRVVGRSITSIVEPDLTDLNENRLDNWQKITKIIQLIWKRWSVDYLNSLQQRNKWHFEKKDAKIGDMVIIKEDNLPSCQWSLGRINNIYPGKDSKEKVLYVRSKSSELEAYLLFKNLFTSILQPKAPLREDSLSYEIKIANCTLDYGEEKDSTEETSVEGSNQIDSVNKSSDDVYSPMCSGVVWSEGDTLIKNAFITEEDDIAPIGKHFLLQTEDQDVDFSFLEASENYSFSLDDGEGLTDLFDCNFSCP
ncbi:integrase catalytic domain-containing protein [Trichonephila clavipes]|nr:integrase catalytic domain-containing protein [Trichonephila clavipes]